MTGERIHLFDGAYVRYDGWYWWLSADRGGITHQVALEPPGVAAFVSAVVRDRPEMAEAIVRAAGGQGPMSGGQPPARAWEQAAALGVTEALDDCSVIVDGAEWDTDAQDADGDPLPSGRLYLTAHDGGRQVLAEVTVRVIEGALS